MQNSDTQTNCIETRIVHDGLDLEGSLRLRYRVFVEELGASTPGVDHINKFERDHFDSYCKYIVLVDRSVDPETRDHVVGTMRLLTACGAKQAGGYCSEREFDLTALHRSARSLMEIGRTCIHPKFRGYNLMTRFWKVIVKIFTEDNIEILFGTASFHGTNLEALKNPLSYLYHQHFAPDYMRTTPHADCGHRLNWLPLSEINIRKAYAMLPPILKYYLRLSGVVGDGVWVDKTFNATDVLVSIETEKIGRNYIQYYTENVD